MAQRYNRNGTNAGDNMTDPNFNRFRKDNKQVTNLNKQSDVMKRRGSTSSLKQAKTAINLPPNQNVKLRPISGRLPQNQIKTSTNQVHKEVIADNNATVEVTVRTHSRGRPQNGDARPKESSWGTLLGIKQKPDTTSFDNFDPLRTLHFLGKELQSKLNVDPADLGDPNIAQMVNAMQVALDRIPPEIASVLNVTKPTVPKMTSTNYYKQGSGRFFSEHSDQPEKLMKPFRAAGEEKGCQTVESVSNFYESQKRLEDQSLKFHADCKQLEKQVMNMNTDKDQLERLLYTERDTVKFLRKQIEDIQSQKVDTTSVAFQALMQERDLLRSRIKKLEKNENRPTPSLQEYKNIIEELQGEKVAAKQENIALRHKLTISNMEKEKFMAILSVRDRQITEIRSEMSQLQEAVNEQLVELQQSTFLSAPSSQSTFVDNTNGGLWHQLQMSLEKCEGGKDAQNHHLAPPTNDTPFHQLFGKSAQHITQEFRELPSGDSSSTNFDPIALKMKKGLYKATPSQKTGTLSQVEEVKQT